MNFQLFSSIESFWRIKIDYGAAKNNENPAWIASEFGEVLLSKGKRQKRDEFLSYFPKTPLILHARSIKILKIKVNLKFSVSKLCLNQSSLSLFIAIFANIRWRQIRSIRLHFQNFISEKAMNEWNVDERRSSAWIPPKHSPLKPSFGIQKPSKVLAKSFNFYEKGKQNFNNKFQENVWLFGPFIISVLLFSPFS
jgi:hypothetical protein